jgi:transposase
MIAQMETDMTRPFSIAFKQKMVERLTGRAAVSAAKLSQETGVRQQNLSRWLIEAGSLPGMVPPIKSAWRVEQKARILADAAALSGEKLRSFLTDKGVSLVEFQRWKSALEDDEKSSVVSSRQIRKLERELQRKEKALAEAAALLVLKKTIQEHLQNEDDDTDGQSEK